EPIWIAAEPPRLPLISRRSPRGHPSTIGRGYGMPWFEKSRTDVPRAWAAALEQVLEAVGARRQVSEFVLTGQHVEALMTLKSGRPLVQQIGRWNSDAAKKAMATLYSGFGDVDAAVLRRWGKVLDAARGNFGWGLTLGDVAGCHWPELMLLQAAA